MAPHAEIPASSSTEAHERAPRYGKLGSAFPINDILHVLARFRLRRKQRTASRFLTQRAWSTHGSPAASVGRVQCACGKGFKPFWDIPGFHF